ncbi:MAG: binding-protein-dependent transport system inner rane component [Hyphomicrobiales bacterium]|nr:binding-protein-dependent transport system inner rane component [Hyphomicrobiales bacterium]
MTAPRDASESARARTRALPGIVSLIGFLGLWEIAARLSGVPAFILPTPSRITGVLVRRFDVIAPEALVTLGEIAGGFVAGTCAGLAFALLMARWRFAAEAFGPLLVVAQALPVFAIAPVLVLWFGFGFTSKIVMCGLIIFFPVATSFFEGLRRTEPGLIDLAQLNNARPFDTLRLIRVPAALPSLAAGLRIAAAVAPLGAVVGEWVGSSSGLGLLMLHANARMQTDLVFAALFVLVVLSLGLWATVGLLTRRLLHWSPATA